MKRDERTEVEVKMTPAVMIIKDRCSEELAAKIGNEVPDLVEHIDRLLEDSMERSLLRKCCGIPENAMVGVRGDGELAYHLVGPEVGFADGLVPPSAVVDYLCRRVASLDHELTLMRQRRAEALKTAEERREQIWTLEAKVKRLEEQLGKPFREQLWKPE